MSELVDTVQKIEREIDLFFASELGLKGIWKCVANESLLDVSELLMSGHGTPVEGAGDPVRRYHLNIANGTSSALRQVHLHASPEKQKPPDDIDDRMRQAISICISYGTIEDAFFSFWKGYATVRIEGKELNFSPTGSALDTRLRAFNAQDGIPDKPPGFNSPMAGARIQRAFFRSLKRAKIREARFDYVMEAAVLDAMAEAYRDHTVRWFGTVPNIDLGSCTLEDLIDGWSYLRAAAQLHALISFLQARGSRDIAHLPNTPALYRRDDFWRVILGKVRNSGAVFKALTFNPAEKASDICITPIVPLGDEYYGMVPSAVLRCNVPRNLLVLLAGRFQQSYSAFSSGKEERLIKDFSARCGKVVLGAQVATPVIEGKQLPDIDLLLGTTPDRRLVVTELKWQLTASSTREVVARNDYLKKGRQQLLALRLFLGSRPDFLRIPTHKGKEIDYDRTEYLLLCKGHLGNEDVLDPNILMCDYDVFAATVEAEGLQAGLEKAKELSFLPVVETDFKLQDIRVKFGDWVVVWKGFLPTQLTHDDETELVEQFYRDAARFTG
jgi:hypothetical protein